MKYLLPVEKIFTVFVFLLFSFMPVFSAENDKYIPIDLFISGHPSESGLMNSFKEIVSSPASPIQERPSKTVKVAAIYPGIQKSDYWRSSVKAMSKRLDELNIPHEILTYFSKPSGNFRRQALQLSEVLKSDVDYVAVSVDNENIKRLITATLASGKPKVFIQNLTTPFERWEDTPPFMYVGFDHLQGARMIAEKYSSLFPDGASYLMLYGSNGTVSEQRGKGFELYALSKGLSPVAKFYTNFSSEKAYDSVMKSLKRGDKFSFIYACSTDIAIGAAKALEDAGLTGEIALNGWGGAKQELELIKIGKLDFTIMRMTDDSGVAIAEAIKMDMIGETDKTPRIFSGEFATITSDMNPDIINRLTERALRYSGR